MKRKLTKKLILSCFIAYNLILNSVYAQLLHLDAVRPTIPEWARHQPIYEADIERMTPEGTFKAFMGQLPRLKQMGVGIIWLMPLHKRGEFKIKEAIIDSLGGVPIPVPEAYRSYQVIKSPYNIHDHYSVNQAYGTPHDLKELVKQAHAMGMYVIVDWVINHTSWDHVLIKEHPEYYLRNANGTVAYVTPWKDIAQLDYTKKELWDYMNKLTCYWLKEYDLDGFRTDVADRVPAEYWKQLRRELDKIKPVFMLAEGFEPAVHPAHDVSYDWFLPTALWTIKEGKRSVAIIDTLLKRETELYPPGALHMRHATNHDIQSSGFGYPGMAKYSDQVLDGSYFKNTPLKEKFGKSLKAFMILATTLPNSVPMIWNGQETGIIEHTPKKLTWQNNEWTRFYTQLFRLYRSQEVLLAGDFQRILINGQPDIYAFSRSTANKKVLVMVNCSDYTKQFDFEERAEEVTDAFTHEKFNTSGTQTITLKPWDYKIMIAGK